MVESKVRMRQRSYGAYIYTFRRSTATATAPPRHGEERVKRNAIQRHRRARPPLGRLSVVDGPSSRDVQISAMQTMV